MSNKFECPRCQSPLNQQQMHLQQELGQHLHEISSIQE
jgi:transcription initiation factor IIE alpha subunit